MGKQKDPGRSDLLEAIFDILIRKGIKDMTMNSIAEELRISKRTLYEIFESKDEMIRRVLDMRFKEHKKKSQRIVETSANMMECLYRHYLLHRDFLCEVDIKFLIDIEKEYSPLHKDFRNHQKKMEAEWKETVDIGIRQGVFRPNVNYNILLNLINIYMKALKRMEENFHSDISLIEAYDTLWDCILRSIASTEGLKLLHNLEIKS